MRGEKERKYLYFPRILSEIFFENIWVLVPLGKGLDPEEDKDLLPENLFEIQSGKFPNILEDGSSFADEDIFLRILGDEKHHECLNHPLFFNKFLDTHEHVIRELLIECEKEFLADHFTDTGLHILISIIIFVIEKRSGWERFFDGCEELFESVFVARRYTDGIFAGFCCMLEISFGIHEDDRFLNSFQNLADFLLLLSTLSRDIDESDDDIRILERRLGLRIDDDIEILF